METSHYFATDSLGNDSDQLNSLYWHDRQCKHCQKWERKGYL